MEAAGVYVSSQEYKVDWIVIKAITDWGDGTKSIDKEARQKKAARNAAEFVMHAIKETPLKTLLQKYPRVLSDKRQPRRRPKRTSNLRSPPVKSSLEEAVVLKPFSQWGMNAVHLEREKHTKNGYFSVHATLHLLVGAKPVHLIGISAVYYTKFGCPCFLAERRFSINGVQPLETLADDETLKHALALKAKSDHQLACALKLRPPLMEQTPAVCDSGDLEIKLIVRKPPELDFLTAPMFYRFVESAAQLERSDGIRLPQGLKDEDLERAAADLNVPQRVYQRLKELSPCTRYLVATSDSDQILQNLLLRSEHRTWLLDIRRHSLNRD